MLLNFNLSKHSNHANFIKDANLRCFFFLTTHVNHARKKTHKFRAASKTNTNTHKSYLKILAVFICERL